MCFVFSGQDAGKAVKEAGTSNLLGRRQEEMPQRKPGLRKTDKPLGVPLPGTSNLTDGEVKRWNEKES